MIGLDTNILIRFLTKDGEQQYNKSYRLLTEEDASFMISYPTLVELIWVLERRYEYGKEQLILLLEEFLATENFHFPDRAAVDNSITKFKTSSADFADCLIGVLNKEQNCETTYTFDKKASALSTFTLLT